MIIRTFDLLVYFSFSTVSALLCITGCAPNIDLTAALALIILLLKVLNLRIISCLGVFSCCYRT